MRVLGFGFAKYKKNVPNNYIFREMLDDFFLVFLAVAISGCHAFKCTKANTFLQYHRHNACTTWHVLLGSIVTFVGKKRHRQLIVGVRARGVWHIQSVARNRRKPLFRTSMKICCGGIHAKFAMSDLVAMHV